MIFELCTKKNPELLTFDMFTMKHTQPNISRLLMLATIALFVLVLVAGICNLWKNSLDGNGNFFCFWNFFCISAQSVQLYKFQHRQLLFLSLSHYLREQSNSWVCACRKYPRLCRMPYHIKNAKVLVRLMCLQFLQRHNQWILQQITVNLREISKKTFSQFHCNSLTYRPFHVTQ